MLATVPVKEEPKPALINVQEAVGVSILQGEIADEEGQVETEEPKPEAEESTFPDRQPMERRRRWSSWG